MPFDPGETVDLNFTGDPDTTVFTFGGQQYTLADGGLSLMRKSTLKVVFRLPRERGKYPYDWTDGENTETGHFRVVASSAPRRPRPARVQQDAGVRARRLGDS